ncbi:MAG: glycosyltransferase family 4 protein [Acidimicrobiales bacterium]
MRILHITDLYPPSIGGLERHVQGLARERVDRGHDIGVVTISTTGVPSVSIDPKGFHIHRVTSGASRVKGAHANSEKPFHPPVPDPIVARQLSRIISEFRPDVVHAHNWIAYSYLVFKTKKHPPMVWTQHDYGLECPKRTLVYRQDGEPCPGASFGHCLPCASPQYGLIKGSTITLGHRVTGRVLNQRIDMVTAISTFVARSAERTLGLSVPVRVIPTFVSNDLVREADSTPRPGFLPDEDGFVLYVGSLGRHKGTFDLIDAYKRIVNPPPLVVLGTPTSDQPREWPVGVTVVENVPHEQVMASWARCAFGVVPSRWPEPFGQVAIEAATMGKAVVATRVGGLVDVVEDGRTGLTVPPGDPVGLAQAIDRLILDPSYAQMLGENGRTKSAQFTVGVVATQLDEVMVEVVERHARQNRTTS